jgi:hypothetical protein
MLFKGMFHASRSQFGVILHCAPEDGRLFARLKPSPASRRTLKVARAVPAVASLAPTGATAGRCDQ